MTAAGAGMLPAWACACARARPREPNGPNLLYIMADDLGYADLSVYGRQEYQTPVLDGLASEGVRLTQAYSAAPVCSPTRVALMTGRYPARLEVGLHEPLTTHPTGLSPNEVTLPRLLRNAGYETALIGKWHLGTLPEIHPQRHGFDEFFGHLGPAIDYVNHTDTENRVHDLHDGTASVNMTGYATDLFTDRAVSFLTRERSAPFFLSLQYNSPHWPWQAPGDPAVADSLLGRRGGTPETFRKMMLNLDHSVGRVLEALRSSGLERDTLVIFTSDNGGEKFSSMGPLRDAKMTLFEGGIRVAAIARWPGVIPAATVSDQVAVTMDWTRTLIEAGGAMPAEAPRFDGIDLLPVLRGASATVPRDLYWRTFQRTRHKALRSGHWKYLVTEDATFLFDLANDTGETNDLKTANATEFARLASLYQAWEREALPPIPLDPSRA
jgi:arylsulfatase A-like enzyme